MRINNKSEPIMCCLQEIYFKHKDTNILTVKGWKSFPILTLVKSKPLVFMLTSDHVNFKGKNITRDKEDN